MRGSQALQTAGASRMAANVMGHVPALRARNDRMEISRYQQLIADRERLKQMMAVERSRKDAKDAKHEANKIGGGAMGAGAGAAAALIAAPFTGGASLALLPALTAAGGAIGGMVDPGGGGEGQTQNIQTLAEAGKQGVDAWRDDSPTETNPLYKGGAGNKSKGGNSAGGSKGGGSVSGSAGSGSTAGGSKGIGAKDLGPY